jgi:hypothetical protein
MEIISIMTIIFVKAISAVSRLFRARSISILRGHRRCRVAIALAFRSEIHERVGPYRRKLLLEDYGSQAGQYWAPEASMLWRRTVSFACFLYIFHFFA